MNLWSTFLELDELYENKDPTSKKKLAEWRLTPTNQSVAQQSAPTSSQPSSQPTSAVNTASKPAIASKNGKPVVVIVSDHGRLRALGTDGTNPAAFVAFPKNLRQFEGQKYEVDQLIWNGKNYRVAGNIVEI